MPCKIVSIKMIIFWAHKLKGYPPFPPIKLLGLVHWDDPERWYGEGGGRGIQDWEHVYTRGGFMLMCGKTSTVLESKIK